MYILVGFFAWVCQCGFLVLWIKKKWCWGIIGKNKVIFSMIFFILHERIHPVFSSLPISYLRKRGRELQKSSENVKKKTESVLQFDQNDNILLSKWVNNSNFKKNVEIFCLFVQTSILFLSVLQAADIGHSYLSHEISGRTYKK